MPLEETENEIRARLQSPDKYDPDSFRRSPFKGSKGVDAIFGCPKGNWKGGRCQVGMQIQSLRFSKEAGWTLAKARAWLKEHSFEITAELANQLLFERLSPDEITTNHILEQFYGAMVNSMQEEYFKTGIHITDITRDCLRPAYYRAKYGGMQFFGLWDTYNLWKGKMLHLTNVLPQGEVEVEWSGVKGRIDDYDPATGIIVEKKIIGRIPTEPLPHHTKQLQFQTVLMRENDKDVNKGFILYISPENKKAVGFEVPVAVADLIDARAEIEEKAKALEKAFLENTIPPRSTSWECSYCPYFTPCLVKEEPALANKIIKEASERAGIKITFVSQCEKCGYIFASDNDPEETEVKCPKCGGKCKMAVNPPKLMKLNYLASIAADGDHHARVYLMDTSVCGNNWRVTDEALERAAKTIVDKPLKIGHGSPKGAEIGRFIDTLKSDGQLYGLAKITDEDAWARIKAGEWGPVSVEFIAKKITCSECGADITFKPDEHVLNRTGHEVIEDFEFEDVALVEIPAYPHAQIEEINGHHDVWPVHSHFRYNVSPTSSDYTHTSYFPDSTTSPSWPTDAPWSNFSQKLTAELDETRQKGKPRPDRQRLIEHFGEEKALKLLDMVGDEACKLLPERGTRLEQIRVQSSLKKVENAEKKGGYKMTEQETRIAELKKQMKEHEEQTEEAIKRLTAERDDAKAKLDEIEKAQHEAKVAALVDLRIKAGLAKETERKEEIAQLGKLPDIALDQLTEDARDMQPREASTPNPKTKAGENLSAVEQTRKRLFGFARDKMASDGGKIVG